jgi:hypothetical protein
LSKFPSKKMQERMQPGIYEVDFFVAKKVNKKTDTTGYATPPFTKKLKLVVLPGTLSTFSITTPEEPVDVDDELGNKTFQLFIEGVDTNNNTLSIATALQAEIWCESNDIVFGLDTNSIISHVNSNRLKTSTNVDANNNQIHSITLHALPAKNFADVDAEFQLCVKYQMVERLKQKKLH